MSRRDALALTDYQLHAIERAALSGRPSDAAVQIGVNLAFDAAAAVRVV
jgi:hypothetical protein